MKSILVLSASFLLITSTLHTAQAADSAEASAASISGEINPKKEAPKLEMWEGKLEKLDAATSDFVVGGKEFKTGRRAIKVLVDGLEKTLAELKIGDAVRVAYYPRKEGACIAKKIHKGEAPSAAIITK